MVLLDIRVVDTDALSYVSRPLDSILASAEQEKKRKYGAACTERRAAFTPFVTSIHGVLGSEARRFFRRLTELLSFKWEKSYGEVMQWTRTRLAFATLTATNKCIRDSRTKWRSLGTEDGASIRLAFY